uniref:Uncharacterized protein n=1 Tax=viral metagenome TaxID=1070528 RepID=A0A6C0LEE2_9ZZZZ
MSPLSCASVTDLYGSNFGLSPDQIVQQTLKNNQKCAEKNSVYQNNLKENEIAGKANFKETYPPETFGNLNGHNTNIPQRTNPSESNLKSTNFGPQPAPLTENDSKFARRLAWTDKNNHWPTEQGFSMFNRFQNPFQLRENFGAPKTDSECLHQLVTVVKELLLVLKIIMLVLILLFVIKILEKKN